MREFGWYIHRDPSAGAGGIKIVNVVDRQALATELRVDVDHLDHLATTVNITKSSSLKAKREDKKETTFTLQVTR